MWGKVADRRVLVEYRGDPTHNDIIYRANMFTAYRVYLPPVNICRFVAASGEEEPNPLPCIVYVHGESFQWNSGNPYDGTVLAATGRVIVITINFRLGVLGKAHCMFNECVRFRSSWEKRGGWRRVEQQPRKFRFAC